MKDAWGDKNAYKALVAELEAKKHFGNIRM
jgi:hypothetical protein